MPSAWAFSSLKQVRFSISSSKKPIPAYGLRMMYEVYKQLQGNAGERQLKDPNIGLTHNMGGFPPMNIISVSIVGN
ncbi:MAG: hypothetical protein K8R45_05030 [Desulfobacterales bacterium]|nr:hypothetical protein [Desulfobacterales bacterium]